MSRQSRWTAPATLALALALVAALTLGACGESAPAKKGDSKASDITECREQWGDVAQTVLGMDQDETPSALASRWTSVIATVDYQTQAARAKDCHANIENQVKAISALRQFSDRLRFYDITYQRRRVEPAAEIYLNDPLPTGPGVKAPAKADVAAALEQLRAYGDAADADLAAGWGQIASVDLDDAAAVDAALKDLHQLAAESQSWRASYRALRVLKAATLAQEQGSERAEG